MILGFFLLQVLDLSWNVVGGKVPCVFQTGSTHYGIGAGVMSYWFLDCGLLVGD